MREALRSGPLPAVPQSGAPGMRYAPQLTRGATEIVWVRLRETHSPLWASAQPFSPSPQPTAAIPSTIVPAGRIDRRPVPREQGVSGDDDVDLLPLTRAWPSRRGIRSTDRRQPGVSA